MVNVNLEYCRDILALIDQKKTKTLKELVDYFKLKINEHFENYDKKYDSKEKELSECYERKLKAVIAYAPFFIEYIHNINNKEKNKREHKKKQNNADNKKLSKLTNLINSNHINTFKGLTDYLQKNNFKKLYNFVTDPSNTTNIKNKFKL